MAFAIDGAIGTAGVDTAKELSASTTRRTRSACRSTSATGRGARHVDLRVRRPGRRAGARFQPGAAHQLPRTSTSRRHGVAERRKTPRRRLGARLDFANLISGQAIGMEMPEKLNPGPFAARVTFFAPGLAAVLPRGDGHARHHTGPSLHPMHYWFIAAAFFAFHLLLAYLVDHVSCTSPLPPPAVVSVGLVVSYLRVVTGMRHALLRPARRRSSSWCSSATRSSSRASPG